MEIAVKFEENSCEFDARFYDAAILGAVRITPNGEEIVTKPGKGVDGFSLVTVEGDKNLKPENIVAGVTIYGVEGTREDEGAILTPVTVVPTGKEYTERPSFDGFSEVTVAGDINLEPQNIAAGVTIYGVEGTLLPGATSDIPEVYLPFVEHALLLFTGEYENMAILEWHEHLAVVFMMSDFTVTEYNATTTEFKAQGWVSCSFNKLTDNWTFTDWRNEPSTGGNYAMNIRYSSVYWYYNGQIIWPFGMSGGGGSGGGAGLNIAYGDTAPDDTTKLWVKAAEPNVVNVTTGASFAAGDLDTVGFLGEKTGDIALACVGSIIYAFGGTVGTKRQNTIKTFNKDTKEIKTLSQTLPVVLTGIISATVGKKVYLFGGYSTSSYKSGVYVFDTESETLSTVSDLPTGLAWGNAAVVGTKVYVLGGWTAQNASDSVYVFDTETETISTLNVKLPTARYAMAVGVIGTSIYLLGGYSTTHLKDVYEFNTVTNVFTKKNYDLPVTVSEMAHAQFGTKVYLFGGNWDGAASDSVLVVDVATGECFTLDTTLPGKTTFPSAVASGSEIYVFPGSGTPNGAICRLVVAALLAHSTMLLQYASDGELFPLVNSDALTISLRPASVHIGDENGIAQSAEAFIFKDGAWVAI